jgi:phenylalanyl-tRNA synthetase beta chain
MRSISLVVDISNYVMLDLGQPIHCYDYETLTEPIVVRRALPGETLQTLDMQTRKLNPEDLLITDSPAGSGSRIIGLAGTMGGLDTEITESTTKVMVEAAYFEPVTIARTAKRHKLPSEASRRYERGIDTNLQTAAAQQCVELLVKYGGPNVKVSDRVGDFNIQKPSEPVQFRASKVQKVFGVKVELSQIREILEDIGCEIVSEKRVEPADILAKPSGTSTSANKVEDEVLAESGDSELTSDNTVFTLRTPSWRSDLKIDVDFVEEIARILDYNSVEARLPVPTFSFSSFPGLTKSQKTVRSLSKILSANGFTEVLSYPFVGANLFEKLLIDSEDPRSYLVKLANPLAEQRAYLRSQILQTLLETAQRNVFRGNENLKLYEVGSVYLAQNFLDLGVPQFPGGSRPKSQDLEVIEQGMPAQPLKLAGVWHGAEILKTPENSEKLVDWSSIFEILSVLGQALNKTLSLDQPNSQTPVGSPFHPERSAYIVTESKVLGEIGELHPQVCVNLQLRPRTVAFEINLNSLFIDSDSGFFSVHPISKYPLVKQDFSFLMPDDLPINQVQTRITELLGDELESLALIDIYKGDSVSEGLKSVTFALKIRSFHETLHPEQIEKIRARIIGDLNLAEVRLRD